MFVYIHQEVWAWIREKWSFWSATSSPIECDCEGGHNPRTRDHKFPESSESQNLVNHGIPTPAPELDTKFKLVLDLKESHNQNPNQKSTPSEAVSAKINSVKISVVESGVGTGSRLNHIAVNCPNPRHIPRSTRQALWDRDGGQCTCCGSKRNLNFDHIQPVALGGKSTASNLWLLCFQCNQRQAIKTFGQRPRAHC